MLKPFCSAALALTLAGCGSSSTGPHQLTPAQLARHIDSLAVLTRNGNRYSVLFVVENGPADGVAPASIVVTTESGPQEWHGFIMRYVGSVAGADSNYDLVAYSDNNMTNVLWAETRFFSGQAPATAVQLLTDTTALVTGGAGTMTITLSSTAGGCVLASGLENYPFLPPGTCMLATFTGSLSWAYPGVAPPFGTIAIASQTFPGLSDKTTP